MAAVKDDEFDLDFLDADIIDEDETDAVSTRVIQLERDSEIPTRYLIRKIFSPHLEPPYHYHPATEASQRRKKVHCEWGVQIGKTRRGPLHPDDLVALMSFEAMSNSSGVMQLDEVFITKVTEILSKLSEGAKLEPLRRSGLQLLVRFSSAAGYKALGQCFLDGKIQDISHFKLVDIQAVSLIIPPPCYIEIAVSTGDGASLKATLTTLLVSHQSVFPFLYVREPEYKFSNGDTDSPTNSPASKTRRIDNGNSVIPSVGIMLMYTQRAQSNSERCLGVVKSNTSQWQKVNVPQAIFEGDEVYFKATNNDGPLFAVKKLSPCPGVRIIIFVNKNMDEVERFYSLITGKPSLAYNKIEEGLSYRKFPLSDKLELQLVSHPSVKSHPVKNSALCFMMNDVNKMCSEIPGGVRNIGEGHWQVKDPEGNTLILYSLLK
ncbi:uncharacterized protein [Montipora foliosa]|uniref:uncharacterized protein n=1 Tax=Montipora foliosa TaxID=591990 RepID=UPI0035F1C60A